MPTVEKFAVSSQAGGFISFTQPIYDISDYSSGIDHKLHVPGGQINIRGNGKGYTIVEQNYDLPTLNQGTYILYGIVPVDSTGVITIENSSYADYVASGGDTDSRRAFCYFRVDSDSKIVPSEILTFNPFTSIQTITKLDSDGTGTVRFSDEIFDRLKKMGFFINTTDDVQFTYRGQFYDEQCDFDSLVSNWKLVYKDTNGVYKLALADDSNKEKVIGIAEKERDNLAGNNFVIASGFVDVSDGISGNRTTLNSEFPAGTHLYLSGTSAGEIVRDFNNWQANQSHPVGHRILEDGYIFEVTVAGSTEPVDEPTWNATIGLTTTDNTITWSCIAEHQETFISDRKVRVGMSLGNGVFYLNSGNHSLIDDHNESAYAHPDLQDAMNDAGIFVKEISQGITDHEYRGQYFDKFAVFTGIAYDDPKYLVYRNADGTYHQALADDTEKEIVIGIGERYYDDSSTTKGFVISSGFVNFDTSGFGIPGTELFLSETNAGEFTTTDTGIKLGTVIVQESLSNGGLILFQVNAAQEVDDHNESTVAHEAIQNALSKAGIYVNVGDLTFRGQSFNEDVALNGIIENFDIVFPDSSNDEYNQAIADGSNKQLWVGMAILASGDLPDIIVSNGFIQLNDTLLPDANFDFGDTVYLSADLNGKLTHIDSGISIGSYHGSNILLLTHGGSGSVTSSGGSGGSGEVTFEDDNWTRLFSDIHYGEIYYDIFVEAGSVDTINGVPKYDFLNRKYNFTEVNLVSNGTWDTDTSDWSPTNCTIASFTPGVEHSNNCLQITRMIDDQEITQTISGLTIGQTYEITFNTMNGTYGSVNYQVEVNTVGVDNTNGTTSSSWVEDSFQFVADATTHVLTISTSMTSGANTVLMDSLSCYHITEQSIEHTITFGESFDRFMVHVEHDMSTVPKLYYWTTTWVEATLDQDFYLVTDTTSIKIKFEWQEEGNIESFGLFWDYQIPEYHPMTRMYETHVLTGNIAQGANFTIPNGAVYINNGKSLTIFKDGVLMELQRSVPEGGDGTGDYLEVDKNTIEVRTSGGWSTGDRVVCLESYAQVDESRDNAVRLNLEHDMNGYHIMTDEVTGEHFKLVIRNGNLFPEPYTPIVG